MSMLALQVAQAQGVLGLDNPANIEERSSTFVRGNFFLASNFASIQALEASDSARYSPTDGKNMAMVQTRISTGFTVSGYQISGLYRQDWMGQTTKDTLLVYRAAQGAQGLSTGVTYPLQYQLSGFEAQGLSLGKSMQTGSGDWNLRMGAQASLLQGTKVKLQTASGQAVVNSAPTISVDGCTSNTYSGTDTSANGFVPQYRNGTPSGSGYSVDIGLTLSHSNGFMLQWVVADATSNMAWKDIPVVTLSGPSVYGGQFPQGRKYLASFEQALPMKNMVAVTMPFRGFQAILTNTHIENLDFPTVGISRVTESGKVVGIDYDTVFNTMGLQLSTQIITLALRTNTLDLSNTKAAAFSMSIKKIF